MRSVESPRSHRKVLENSETSHHDRPDKPSDLRTDHNVNNVTDTEAESQGVGMSSSERQFTHLLNAMMADDLETLVGHVDRLITA